MAPLIDDLFYIQCLVHRDRAVVALLNGHLEVG